MTTAGGVFKDVVGKGSVEITRPSASSCSILINVPTVSHLCRSVPRSVHQITAISLLVLSHLRIFWSVGDVTATSTFTPLICFIVSMSVIFFSFVT